MQTYQLTLIIDYQGDDFEAVVERCYPEFSDGTVCTRDGVHYIVLDREAISLDAACKSALASAKTVGISVSYIQIHPKHI